MHDKALNFQQSLIYTLFPSLKNVHYPQWTKRKSIKGGNTNDIGTKKKKGIRNSLKHIHGSITLLEILGMSEVSYLKRS